MLRASMRSLIALMTVFSLTASPILAQTELGTALRRHYWLRAVTCNACHRKGENDNDDYRSREALTEFGKVTAKLVEGKRVTERLDEVEDAERDEKRKVQEEIETEFTAALKKLDEWKNPGGKTWAQTIQDGEVAGIRTRN